MRDVRYGQAVAAPSIMLQYKIQRPAQFEITDPTRQVIVAWIGSTGLH